MTPQYKDAIGVYQITCNGNGRIYVGSSARSLSNRWAEHAKAASKGKHKNRVFQRSWNKYGAESFSFQVIELCAPEDCIACEQRWIDSLGAYHPKNGMNLAPKAGSTLGLKFTPQSRAIKSAQAKEQFMNPESRAAHSSVIKRAKATEESKTRQSAGQKRRFSTAEARLALSEQSKAITSTPHFRAAAAARARKQFANESLEAKAARMAKVRLTVDSKTPEEKMAISERKRATWAKRTPAQNAAINDKKLATRARNNTAKTKL
jgi:group I intron endonuclease